MLINILTHPAFWIVTFLAGILLGNFFAIGRDRRKEFNTASDEFRKIFTQVLVDIHDENVLFDVYSVDKDVFKKLQVAYLIFRHYLKGIHRWRYDEAWDQYRYDCKEHWDFDSDIRDAVAKDIEHLLEFTEYRLLRSISFVCQRLWRRIRFKLFGPNKKTKELIEKVSKHDESPKK